jgi:hypothetical protein
MSKAEEYRARAEDVERLARRMSQREERTKLESIARQWRELAAQAEANLKRRF